MQLHSWNLLASPQPLFTSAGQFWFGLFVFYLHFNIYSILFADFDGITKLCMNAHEELEWKLVWGMVKVREKGLATAEKPQQALQRTEMFRNRYWTKPETPK